MRKRFFEVAGVSDRAKRESLGERILVSANPHVFDPGLDLSEPHYDLP